MQLLVLGMHRSGTSSVTRLLNMAGAYFGPEGIATDPNDENPKGFWERRDVGACATVSCTAAVRLVEARRLLDRQHSGRSARAVLRRVPQDRLSTRRAPSMGDEGAAALPPPPVLRPALEAPVYVHVTREPLEIAESLAGATASRSRSGSPCGRRTRSARSLPPAPSRA